MDLSICIPTHGGRRDELAYALEVLLPQLADHEGRVEVCISDNASRDGTEELVAELSAVHPGLVRYARHRTDRGAARNVLGAAGMARGRWIWFHSSDDALAPDAVASVLARLRAPDAGRLTGLTIGRATMDAALTHELDPEPRAMLPDARVATVYVDPREALVQCGVLQTHLTCLVVRRSAWEQALAGHPEEPLTLAPHFPHSLVVGRALLDGGAWAWEPRKLVRNRAGNTSLARTPREQVAANVLVARELARMWRVLLGDGPALRVLLDRSRRIWADDWWLTEAKNGAHAGFDVDRELLGFIPALWRLPSFWTRTLARLLVPHPLARAGRSLALRLTPMRAVGDGAVHLDVGRLASAEACSDVDLQVVLRSDGPVLRSHPPAPVHLVVSWSDVDDRPPRTLLLPGAVRPSRPRSITLRVATPLVAGDAELTVALEQHGGHRLASITRAVRITDRDAAA